MIKQDDKSTLVDRHFSPRGSPRDMFMHYSARRATEERCIAFNTNISVGFEDVWGLPWATNVCTGGPCHSAQQRVYVQHVRPHRAAPGGGFHEQEAKRTLDLSSIANKNPPELSTHCPSVVLLGIDVTPDPGFRGPTNFLGVGCNLKYNLSSIPAHYAYPKMIS